MKVKELRDFLEKFDDNLEVKFIKYPSLKPLAFWHTHEWYVCEQKYMEGGPQDKKFLAIQVEDDS